MPSLQTRAHNCRIGQGFIIFMMILATALTTDAAKQRAQHTDPIIRNLAETGDLEDLCDKLEKKYEIRCIDYISEELTEEIQKLAKDSTAEELMLYLNDNLFQADPDLDMDPIQCEEVRSLIAESDDKEIVDVLLDQLENKPYSFKATRVRTQKSLARRAANTRKSRSCNLKTLLEHHGKVTKNFFTLFHHVKKVSMPSFSIGSPSVIKSFIETASEMLRPDSTRTIDKDIEAERTRREKEKAKRNEITEKERTLEKECFINEDDRSCKRLTKLQDEFIMNQFGPNGIKMIRSDPRCRDVVLAAAKLYSWYSELSLISSLDLLASTLGSLRSYAVALLAIMVIVLLFYRGELKSLTSITLASSGFSVIPLIAIFNKASNELMSRASGLLVTGSVAAIAICYNLNLISPYQAALVAYITMVAYVNIFRSNTNSLIPAYSLVPIILWAAFQSADFSKISFAAPSFGYQVPIAEQVTSWAKHEIPDIWAIIAISCILTIFLVCHYCDVLGYSVYRDVANRASRSRPTEYTPPKPTIGDFLTASVGINTIVVVGALALPGILYHGTWVMVMGITALSIIIAGLIYQFSFHDEYIREGWTTASVTDRVIDSMNIIAGVAPKEIILPRFYNCVMALIVAMAFFTGLRINWIAGAACSVLVGIRINRSPENLQNHISWFTGAVIAACGSYPHAIIGVLYIMLKVGRTLKFGLEPAQGEVLRDVSLN